MTRTVLFDSPFLLGFDQTRTLIERAAKAAAEGYPPYNVEDLGDRRVRITLAVAGFTPDQLSVSVEGRQLVITGERTAEEKTYVHRGIAARGFTRAFVASCARERRSWRASAVRAATSLLSGAKRRAYSSGTAVAATGPLDTTVTSSRRPAG